MRAPADRRVRATAREACWRSLDSGNHALAVEIAALPEKIRGFGHVKERQLAEAQRERELLLRRFGEAK